MIATELACRPSPAFRDYLRSLPDELLRSVAEDYIWLAGLVFHQRARNAEFRQRRDCCCEECARRGVPLSA